MDPPARLDMPPGFADDGFLAGDSREVLRAVQHIKPLMPALGLRFSRLEAIPAAGEHTTIDANAYIQCGCTINKDQCASVMKSPIGNVEFCEQEVGKRVGKAVRAVHAIRDLPDQHCALNLLRYQTGRLDYTTRTTPIVVLSESPDQMGLRVAGSIRAHRRQHC